MASFSYKNDSAGSSGNQKPVRCKNFSTQKNQEKLQLRKYFGFGMVQIYLLFREIKNN